MEGEEVEHRFPPFCNVALKMRIISIKNAKMKTADCIKNANSKLFYYANNASYQA